VLHPQQPAPWSAALRPPPVRSAAQHSEPGRSVHPPPGYTTHALEASEPAGTCGRHTRPTSGATAACIVVPHTITRTRVRVETSQRQPAMPRPSPRSSQAAKGRPGGAAAATSSQCAPSAGQAHGLTAHAWQDTCRSSGRCVATALQTGRKPAVRGAPHPSAPWQALPLTVVTPACPRRVGWASV
jgi:hypothetical protein